VADNNQFDELKFARRRASQPGAPADKQPARQADESPVHQADELTGERLSLQTGDGPQCAECELLLTDAIDQLLTAQQQAGFDRHLAACKPCRELLAEARRGAAWLEALRTPAPEPSADLMNRILAATASAVATATTAVPLVPGFDLAAQRIDMRGVQPSLRSRLAELLRESSIYQVLLQPRLAMTAAMAFLSIALTLNLTGVRLQDLRLSQLQPASLQRDFYQAKAHAAQYVTGLRVVHELESQVSDLRGNDEEQAPSQFAPNPFAPDQLQPSSVQPSPVQPNPVPSSPIQPSGPRPLTPSGARPAAPPAPNSGTSQRRSVAPRRWLLAGVAQSPTINSNQEGDRA